MIYTMLSHVKEQYKANRGKALTKLIRSKIETEVGRKSKVRIKERSDFRHQPRVVGENMGARIHRWRSSDEDPLL